MIPARPTTYSGIRMRSRLEARYAAVLDAFGLTWTYEPRAYANAAGQYLPDFELPADDLAPIQFIEVRPTLDRGMLALTQMPVIWDSEPDAILVVTMPRIPFWYVAYGDRDRTWKLIPMSPWT